MSSAEAIAQVVSDLRHGRIRPTVKGADLAAACLGTAADGPVVDVTAIFRTKVIDRQHSIALYDDHPSIAPPWPAACFAWENTFGNVYVASMVAAPGPPPPDKRWEPHEPIDWDAVAWDPVVVLWAGGYSPGEGGPIPTYGPLYVWQFAVGGDGKPLDIHWQDLLGADVPELSERLTDQGLFDNALLTILQSLNFLNCRNVEVVEPKRERHERRRLERVGVKVQTINVFPVGRSTRSSGHADARYGVALHPVRGHFSHYGPAYGRGLLFGRLAGKFWIQQHTRGTPEIGVNLNDYRLDA